MFSIVIIIAAFVGVAALVLGVGTMFRGPADEAVEDRLDVLAGNALPAHRGSHSNDDPGLLSSPLDDMPDMLEQMFSRVTNVRLLLDQADVNMAPTTFLTIVLGLAGAGLAVGMVTRLPFYVIPFIALTLAAIPIAAVCFKRSARFKKFSKQLPEALELVARALRAGHSLGSGFQLVGKEMADPIGTEFNRIFEEQNLGITLERALDEMTNRIPNLDLRFFSTAVILQRQTGGDLAEILDKIGHLVRERFKLYGQIQALTGEGRLSGVVLLALPPVLFLVMMRLNYNYAVVLFDDPMGRQMLVGAVLLQLLGALVIRKIVNIKV